MKISELQRRAVAHHQAGQLFEAEAMYREVLFQKPSSADSLHYLGMLLHQTNRTAEGIPLIERSIKLAPTDAIFRKNFAKCQMELGNHKVAIFNAETATRIDPKFADAHCLLGEAKLASYDQEGALISFKRAYSLCPDNLGYLKQLALAQWATGNLADARPLLRAALDMHPDDFGLISQLALVERGLNNLPGSIELYRRAVSINPSDLHSHTRLADAYASAGDRVASRTQFRKALTLDPSASETYSAFLLGLQYDPDVADAELFDECIAFGNQMKALYGCKPWHQGGILDGQRKLRIGYVSSDFRNHPVSFFFLPILEQHDRGQFDIFAYYCHPKSDDYTERVKALSDKFVQCTNLSDDQMTELIRADAVDILVDLSGHSAGNRLRVFARGAAPIQLTWIGTAGTTGLPNMHYRITDEWMDPPGMTDAQHAEKLIRLPTVLAPFSPFDGAPEVNQLPSLGQAQFTFGCLNNPRKINESVVEEWAQILNAVPHSRMLIGNMDDPVVKSRIVEGFADFGVGAERLELRNRLPAQSYLELHHQIDLMLDPFPYNGGTSTNYSLWMGVPVLTLAGTRSAARVGVSLLQQAALTNFIAGDKTEYVNMAIEWSSKREALNVLRLSMRTRLTENPLCKPDNIAKAYETALRSVWTEFCSKVQIASSSTTA